MIRVAPRPLLSHERSAFGHRYGLAGLSTAQSDRLWAEIRSLEEALAANTGRIHGAAAAGVEPQIVSQLNERFDEISASTLRLENRIAVLTTDADVAAWEAEYRSLAAVTARLADAAYRAVQAQQSTGIWQIALWTGATVGAAIGAVLIVRWAVRRRR